MSIEGRIAVDVSFADSATSSGVQSVKKIALVDTTAYANGKVAITTGTVGTASVAVNLYNSGYRNAAGSLVEFSAVSRIAFAATGGTVQLVDSDAGNDACLRSSGGRVALTDWPGGAGAADLVADGGTASYTLIIYGS